MPVSADDVALSVRIATDTLAATGTGWDRPAGGLTWTCWETTERRRRPPLVRGAADEADDRRVGAAPDDRTP
ncbi:hypothetical protein [Actinophytocola sp. KF-1]